VAWVAWAALAWGCGDSGGTSTRPDGASFDGRPTDGFDWPDSSPLVDRQPIDAPVTGTCTQDLCVDPQNGDDAAGDGSAAHPFRTLTRALQAVSAGQTIGVHSGTADLMNGESFPLQIPADVTVKTIDSATEAIISGGNPTFTCSGGATVSGFDVQPQGTAFALTASGRITIDRNTIHAAAVPAVVFETDGVELAAASNWFVGTRSTAVAVDTQDASATLLLERNAYSGQLACGLRLRAGAQAELVDELFTDVEVGIHADSGATLIARLTVIDGGTVGVQIDPNGQGGLFDLGSAADPGQNSLVAHAAADLCVAAPLTVQAVGNSWDAVAPSTDTQCASGVDLGVSGGGTVIWQ
jgi:hypothetical protein